MDNILYTVTGILFTISLESFVILLLLSFQVIPGRFFLLHRQTVIRNVMLFSFIIALAGGAVWTVADGHFMPGHYLIAFLPGMFVFILLIGQIAGWGAKKETVELIMRAEEYTLETRDGRMGGRWQPVRMARWGDRLVKFSAASPAYPIDMKAYCEQIDGHYICTAYLPLNPQKKSWKERIEMLHTAILAAVALIMMLPATPIFLWYLEHGAGDNPYFRHMGFCFGIIIFGGCRKLFMHGKGCFLKMNRIIFTTMYYVMLVGGIFYLFGMR